MGSLLSNELITKELSRNEILLLRQNIQQQAKTVTQLDDSWLQVEHYHRSIFFIKLSQDSYSSELCFILAGLALGHSFSLIPEQSEDTSSTWQSFVEQCKKHNLNTIEILDDKFKQEFLAKKPKSNQCFQLLGRGGDIRYVYFLDFTQSESNPSPVESSWALLRQVARTISVALPEYAMSKVVE